MKIFIKCFFFVFVLICFSLFLFTDMHYEKTELVMQNDIVQVDSLALVDMNKCVCCNHNNQVAVLQLDECEYNENKDNNIISLTSLNENYIELTIGREIGFEKHFLNLKYPS